MTHFANVTNKERLEPMLRNAQLAVLNPRENPQQFINGLTCYARSAEGKAEVGDGLFRQTGTTGEGGAIHDAKPCRESEVREDVKVRSGVCLVRLSECKESHSLTSRGVDDCRDWNCRSF